MEEATDQISPRISFSHDLATITAQPAQTDRSDTSPMSRLPEPDFDFANAAAADVAPAGRLFADGKLLPLPPLPPSPNTCPKPHGRCKHHTSCMKPQTCQKPAFWTSRPFSRSNSANSATAAPRAASGMFCPSFPLLRSRSAGSAGVPQEGFGGHRPQYKKVGATAAATTSNSASPRVYYYGGSSRDSTTRGVRVSPVLNVPSIGTGLVNVFSHLLCDCGSKSARSRNFGVAS